MNRRNLIGLLLNGIVLSASTRLARSSSAFKIGIITPLYESAGLLPHNSSSFDSAIKLAPQLLKHLGYQIPLELYVASTNGNPDYAGIQARKLINMGCGALITTVNDRSALGLAQVAEQQRTPIIFAASSNPEITDRGFKYVFRNRPDPMQNLIQGIRYIDASLRQIRARKSNLNEGENALTENQTEEAAKFRIVLICSRSQKSFPAQALIEKIRRKQLEGRVWLPDVELVEFDLMQPTFIIPTSPEQYENDRKLFKPVHDQLRGLKPDAIFILRGDESSESAFTYLETELTDNPLPVEQIVVLGGGGGLPQGWIRYIPWVDKKSDYLKEISEALQEVQSLSNISEGNESPNDVQADSSNFVDPESFDSDSYNILCVIDSALIIAQALKEDRSGPVGLAETLHQLKNFKSLLPGSPFYFNRSGKRVGMYSLFLQEIEQKIEVVYPKRFSTRDIVSSITPSQ